jgi:serine/threonine-protein kinase
MLRRPTAIKLLPRDHFGEESQARFEREVQLTSQLTHPNTVAIYDYGCTPEGQFYYVMEYLEGTDLDRLVRREGPQPPERVIHILRQISGALTEAHDRGMVHRDIKPANIMVCRRWGAHDVVKVLDFGLIREMGPSDVTQAGILVGTPDFMAPEAIRSPGDVDGRADLYAVGGVGYYLLTARPPFDGSTSLEKITAQLTAEPLAPSARLGRVIAPDLERVIMSCLRKSPADRPASAGALLDALSRCADADRWTQEAAAEWALEHPSPTAPDIGAGLAADVMPTAEQTQQTRTTVIGIRNDFTTGGGRRGRAS